MAPRRTLSPWATSWIPKRTPFALTTHPFDLTGGPTLITPTQSIGNDWFHIASTYDNSTGFRGIYLNGQLIASTNEMGTPPAFSGGTVRIGFAGWSGSSNHLIGQMDDTAIFSSYLDASEVNTIMAGDFSSYIPGYGAQAANVSASLISSALLMFGLAALRRKK